MDTVEEKTIPDGMKEITEGKAKILIPDSNTVFYNNVQEFNRDLSVAVIKKTLNDIRTERLNAKIKKKSRKEEKGSETENQESKEEQKPNNTIEDESKEKGESQDGFRILEALSATGLRAVRYSKEISGIETIVANDLSQNAVQMIERNIKHNDVGHNVSSSHSDASLLMYQHRFPSSKRFHVIDLDPYGSPCQFLDSAVQSIEDGGLLCVTCTDMGALCGNHGEAAYAKYGGMPLKSKYCHEMALRIVIASVDSHAGHYKRYVVPLLSLSADFYIRVFLRVFTSGLEVKRSASKRSYVFHCNGCETFHLQPVGKAVEVGDSKKFNPASGPVVSQYCVECGHTFKIGGPIWSNPIHDVDFVSNLLEQIQEEKECYKTADRIIGTLSMMKEELPDQPLYYVLDQLCNVIHCQVPPQKDFKSALLRADYMVSCTHAHKAGLKTNAPSSVVWDILRCWLKEHPVNMKKIKEQSPAAAILSKQPKIEANFEYIASAVPASKLQKLARYPDNPLPDWGPKARARPSNKFSNLAEKRSQLQGKRKKKEKGQVMHDGKFQFPCKRFKKGICPNDDEGCKFLHKIETEEMNNENNVEIENVENGNVATMSES